MLSREVSCACSFRKSSDGVVFGERVFSVVFWGCDVVSMNPKNPPFVCCALSS